MDPFKLRPAKRTTRWLRHPRRFQCFAFLSSLVGFARIWLRPQPPLATMRLRILVLGEERVGKSCLIKKYRYNQADTPQLLERVEADKFEVAYEPTIGVEYRRGHIDGKRAPLRPVEGKS